MVRTGCARWGGSAAGDPQREPARETSRTRRRWKSPAKEGESPVAGLAGALCPKSASTAGHEEARGKQGSPLPKAKYLVRPIADEYREGKVKSTPGGE